MPTKAPPPKAPPNKSSKTPQRPGNKWEVLKKTLKPMKFRVEYINDSGAGKPVYSDCALKEAGMDPMLWKLFLTMSRHPMIFETGNGMTKAGLSLAITSQLVGHTECYKLNDAPLCMPMGDIVQKQKMASYGYRVYSLAM